jgi:hypothetical protein
MSIVVDGTHSFTSINYVINSYLSCNFDWNLFNYARIRVLLEKLTVAQVIKKFTTFYGTQIFITVGSTIFWDITFCSPLKVNRRFGGTYLLHLQGLICGARHQRESRWHAGFHPGSLLRLFDHEFGGNKFFGNVGWLPSKPAYHKLSRWCLAPLIRPWRLKRYVSPKRLLTFNELHGVISQKTELFITTGVRTSSPAFITMFTSTPA